MNEYRELENLPMKEILRLATIGKGIEKAGIKFFKGMNKPFSSLTGEVVDLLATDIQSEVSEDRSED